MLRIYFLQHWFNLSDPGAEEELYDSPVLRRFAAWIWAERRRPRTKRPS
jgi:IS5 family transposase